MKPIPHSLSARLHLAGASPPDYTTGRGQWQVISGVPEIGRRNVRRLARGRCQVLLTGVEGDDTAEDPPLREAARANRPTRSLDEVDMAITPNALLQAAGVVVTAAQCPASTRRARTAAGQTTARTPVEPEALHSGPEPKAPPIDRGEGGVRDGCSTHRAICAADVDATSIRRRPGGPS